MGSYQSCEVLSGVFHIRDEMGVYMTLLVGEEQALLIDTGYGLSDVAAYIRSLTDKPLTVLLTHAHHDHALGARWFDRTIMFPEDAAAFTRYTSKAQRAKVLQQAQAKGLCAASDYLTAPIPPAQPMREGEMDLGGMTAQIILCPGHTPGSAVVYIPQRALLLTGDDWNPCTWLFFPEALPAQTYRSNIRSLLALPFESVLCSHRETLYPRTAFEDFALGLTDEVLLAARPVDLGHPVDTREAIPAPGQQFVFDFGKTDLCDKEENA